NLESLHDWNGAVWSSVPGALRRNCDALRACDLGNGPELYAGGRVRNPGFGVENLGRWNGTTWSGVGALDGAVHELELGDLGAGQRLFVAGQFFHDGTATVARTLVWDGATLAPLAQGVDGEVLTLAVDDRGPTKRVWAHGTFGSASGAGARRIASWDGAAW